MNIFKSRRKAKIFGIGLSKTGTSTLTEALKILGISSLHYPRSLDEIIDFDSATDLPVVASYKLLDKMYPGSKFILTVRDESEWLDSIIGHRKRLKSPKPGSYAYEMRCKVYGRANSTDRNELSACYKNHIEQVKKYFSQRPQDLLILEIGTGVEWEELCRFLNKKIPKTEFPKKNIKSEVALTRSRQNASG